jgi:hypothetical protein
MPKDDPNCMGAWYMNSAGDATEVDQSGESGDLEELAGTTISPSADVPSGYSGNSQDIEKDDTEGFYHADGNSTDISGADQPISFGGWFKAESDTAADQTLICKFGGAGNRQFILRYDDSEDTWEALISNDGTSVTQCIGTAGLDVGVWHHYVLVYNDTDMRLYVDGSLDSNGADNPKTYSNGIYNGNEQFRIGIRSDSADRADGLFDEYFVFDRALTADEVVIIYNNGISRNKGAND